MDYPPGRALAAWTRARGEYRRGFSQPGVVLTPGWALTAIGLWDREGDVTIWRPVTVENSCARRGMDTVRGMTITVWSVVPRRRWAGLVKQFSCPFQLKFPVASALGYSGVDVALRAPGVGEADDDRTWAKPAPLAWVGRRPPDWTVSLVNATVLRSSLQPPVRDRRGMPCWAVELRPP